MKPILVIVCIMGVTAAATLVARDAGSQPENADALTAISRELEGAKEAKKIVTIQAESKNISGVPTDVSPSTVSLQTEDRLSRVVVRLDRIIGVHSMNSAEESKAAQKLLQEAMENSFPQPDAETAGVTKGRVRGTVTMNGKPLSSVNVLINVDETLTLIGRTDEQGKYDVTFKFPSNHEIGAWPVRFTWPEGAQATIAIPEEYGTKSTLTATLKPGENVLDFDLTSK